MTRTLRAPLIALTLTFGLMLAMAMPASAQVDGLVQEVTEDILDADGDVIREFVGEIGITEITRDGDTLNLAGNIMGEAFDLAGDSLGMVDTTFDTTGDLTREGPGNSCQILALDLGPIDLDLLGLVVDLSDIQLDIVAERGPGNLLGNLLRAVAGLLDGPGLGGGILNAVDGLLDRITGLLDGLLAA